MQTMSPQIEKVLAAMCEAQATMKKALKDSTNPFHRSKYADLESVWDACKDAVASSNLVVMQNFETIDGMPHIVTMIGHSSGQWLKSYLKLPFPFETVDKSGQVTTKNDPQTLGSTITYCRRYALAAMLGVIQTDDDAQEAVTPPKIYPKQQVQPQPEQKPAEKNIAQVKAPIAAKEVKKSEKKIEPTPFDSPLETLKEYVAMQGGDNRRVMEFIAARSVATKKPPEKIIEGALLSKEISAKFFDAFTVWCNEYQVAANS